MMLRGSRRTAPVAVAALAVGLTLGASATATAEGLTRAAVKKIAKNVVQRQAPSLSVAKAQVAGNADALAGKPPTAYEETRQVITVTVPPDQPTTGFSELFALGFGSYEVSYSAYGRPSRPDKKTS